MYMTTQMEDCILLVKQFATHKESATLFTYQWGLHQEINAGLFVFYILFLAIFSF